MGLSTLIAQSTLNTVSDDQGPWRQFILDHLLYISIRSKTYLIEPDLMNLYRYDLKRFLKNYMKLHEDIAWIVLLLNDLPNDFSFDTSRNLVIPTDRFITDLYRSFRTIAANAN